MNQFHTYYIKKKIMDGEFDYIDKNDLESFVYEKRCRRRFINEYNEEDVLCDICSGINQKSFIQDEIILSRDRKE